MRPIRAIPRSLEKRRHNGHWNHLYPPRRGYIFQESTGHDLRLAFVGSSDRRQDCAFCLNFM